MNLRELTLAGIITPKEAQALTLEQQGLSTRTIATALDISRGAVRDRLRNAHAKIARHERRKAV